jgi:heat-inducible transcriptional repressor
MTNVLSEPEFVDSDEARQALHILEERALLENLLASTVMTSDVGGIQVLIGGEGTWEELRQCSIILARYGDPESLTGSIGVLGPIRMPYDRAISTVRFVANVLSDLVSETLAV